MTTHTPKASQPLILVVEDNPLMRLLLQDILQHSEYQVALAANAHKGLKFLHTSCPTPQLIITDISMPSMDGYEFLQAVRAEKRWQSIPVIVISGQDAASVSEEQIQSMGVSYFAKPFEVPDLLEAVEQAISQATTP